MPVTVYFRNGGSTTVQKATRVHVEPITQSPSSRGGEYGLSCYAEGIDTRIAHFVMSEIVGYEIAEPGAKHSGAG